MIKIAETAYILAGGKSRRMGSDKLFLSDGESTLLQRAISSSLQVFKDVKIVAPTVEKFESLTNQPEHPISTLIDSPKASGPMAGLIAALEDSQTNGDNACFIVAADLYDFTPQVATFLIQEYKGEQFLGISEESEPQPLCGIYNISSLDQIISNADKKLFRMKQIVIELEYQLVNPPGKNWRNINNPADLLEIGFSL